MWCNNATKQQERERRQIKIEIKSHSKWKTKRKHIVDPSVGWRCVSFALSAKGVSKYLKLYCYCTYCTVCTSTYCRTFSSNFTQSVSCVQNRPVTAHSTGTAVGLLRTVSFRDVSISSTTYWPWYNDCLGRYTFTIQWDTFILKIEGTRKKTNKLTVTIVMKYN